ALPVYARPGSGTFFSSLLPTPPRSTLFPYTTLFRSRAQMGVRLHPDHRLSAGRRTGRRYRRGGGRRNDAGRIRQVGLSEHVPAGDRKSTRLNSSHVKISYAVFCLKKKKNTRHIPTPV